jgi:hypothetical protein
MLKLNIRKMIGLDKNEREAYREASEAMIYELRNNEFWNEVQRNFDSFTHKNGYSFASYKRLILSGRNKYEKFDDNEIDLSVTKYYSFRNVIGYTKPSTVMTWINKKYIGMEIGSFAGHIYHEHCGHNFGFIHPNTDRQSLVYQTGYIMRDCVRKRVGKMPLKNKVVKLPWYKRLYRWLF